MQVFDDGEHRPFSGIQRDEIDKVENTPIAQLAQFGVNETATQNNTGPWRNTFNSLGDSKRGINAAGEWYGEQHQIRTFSFNSFDSELIQISIHQGGGLCQRLRQGFKARLAGGQRLGITNKFKARINSITNHIRQIIEIQRGVVSCPIVRA